MATPNQQAPQQQQPKQTANTVSGKENTLCNYTIAFSEIIKFSIKDGVLHFDAKAQEATLHNITIAPKIQPQEASLTSIAKEDIVAYIDKNIVLLSEAYRTAAPTNDETNPESNTEASVNEANIINQSKDKLNKVGEKLFSVEDKPKTAPTPQPNTEPATEPTTEPQPNAQPRHEGIVNDVQADIYKGRDPKSFANISAIKELSVVIAINHLTLKNSRHIERGRAGTILEAKFDAEEVEKYVNHFELKKLKLFINNEEVEKPAKSELKFIAAIFNGFIVKIKL